MKNFIGNITNNFHTNFWFAIFLFIQKWDHACLQRAYTKAEVSLHIGYYLGFQPHPVQERMGLYPTQNIMTLFRSLCLLLLPPHINTYLLGRLYTFQCCTTALAVCCAAIQTIMLCKALKMTIHMHIVIYCQTFHHSNCISGACHFFYYSISYLLLPSNCFY